MRVLVVDDNADIRMLLEQVFEQGGFEVVQAHGGPRAMEILAAPPLPDAVVLDVQMPDMDGWETLSAIRRDPATAHLPVILCTVKGRPEDSVHGWRLGCDGYVRKPLDIDELLAGVRSAISRHPAERARVRGDRLAAAELAVDEARRGLGVRR
jgi:twitching motility two-component system response regulator PilH